MTLLFAFSQIPLFREVLFLREFSISSGQMTKVTQQSLRLLYDAEEEYHGLQITWLALYVLYDRLPVSGQLSLQGRCIRSEGVGCIVACRVAFLFEDVYHSHKQLDNLLLICLEGYGILAAHRHKVVADMFAARLHNTLHTIYHLRDGRNGKEVPCVTLYTQELVDAAKCQYLLATLSLELIALIFNA